MTPPPKSLVASLLVQLRKIRSDHGLTVEDIREELEKHQIKISIPSVYRWLRLTNPSHPSGDRALALEKFVNNWNKRKSS